MPLPDFDTLAPVTAKPLPDFESLQPVQTDTQPSRPVPQMSEYHPSLMERVKDTLAKVRGSETVERVLGQTPEELAANPPAESAAPGKTKGVMGLFESTKPVVQPYENPKTALDGLHNWAAGVVNSVASPAGLALAPLGASKETPALVKKAMGLTFGTQGAKMGFDTIKDAIEKHKSMNPSDWVQSIGNVLNSLLMIAGGVHALKPAIKTGETVTTGKDHVDAYEQAKKTIPDTSGSQEGFVDKDGKFLSREQAAQVTQLPTKREEGKLHSSDLPETKEGEPPNEKEKGKEVLGTTAPPNTGPGVVGLGAAEASDFGPKGSREVTGVAQRVRTLRENAEMTEPTQPGIGWSTEESIQHGRERLKAGADPEKIMKDFEATQRASSSDFAVARAHQEELAKATNKAEEDHGTYSDEFQIAKAVESAWALRTKAMQTESAKTFQAQQAQVDIDTGTVSGLARAHRDATGEEFTPKQKDEAERIKGKIKPVKDGLEASESDLTKALKKKADEPLTPEEADLQRQFEKEEADRKAENDKAEAETDEAAAKVKAAVDKANAAKVQEDAEKAALKAASKTVREAAKRRAEQETKDRVEQSKRDRAAGRVQSDVGKSIDKLASERAIKDAIAKAEAEAKARIAKAKAARKAAEAQVKAAREAEKRISEFHRRNAAKRAAQATKDRVLKANKPKYVWAKAKELYLDKGITDFNDIINGLATDLGMKVEDVKQALAADKQVKRLADEVWKKQNDYRHLHEQAKAWLRAQQTPGYIRALERIPRFLFGLKVGFHGTVALGTHAPSVAFQPKFWGTYIRDFGKMYKMVNPFAGKGKVYYEQQIQEVQRRPNYLTALRAGAVVDPSHVEDYNSPKVAQYFSGLTGMGNRGYTVLKILRMDMFDQHWNQLPKSARTPEVAKAIADGINHATGVVKAPAPAGANLAFFAPRLEASRVAWLAVDPIKAAKTFANWKNATEAEKIFAVHQLKEKAWVFGTLASLLALNQGMLDATGSDQQINFTDPMRHDFLKFKVAGTDVSYGNAMVSMARLPVQLWAIRESDGGKLKHVIYPDEDTAKVLFKYLRSQMSPFASLATTLWLKADFENRPLPDSTRPMPKRLEAEGVKPYTWTEFVSQAAAPIPAEEAVNEVFQLGLGAKPEQVKAIRKAWLGSIFMAATGARVEDDNELKSAGQP